MIYMTFIYQTVSQCIAAIQIEQLLLVQSIDKEWQIGSHLHFIRFFQTNVQIYKQNREFKNDKRVGTFSKLHLRKRK